MATTKDIFIKIPKLTIDQTSFSGVYVTIHYKLQDRTSEGVLITGIYIDDSMIDLLGGMKESERQLAHGSLCKELISEGQILSADEIEEIEQSERGLQLDEERAA